MSRNSKLFVEFRVEFKPNTNQDLLHEISEIVKDRLYDMFECDPSDGPMPMPTDIKYEVVKPDADANIREFIGCQLALAICHNNDEEGYVCGLVQYHDGPHRAFADGQKLHEWPNVE